MYERNDTKAIKDALKEIAEEFGITTKEVKQHVKFDYFFKSCVAERLDLNNLDMWGEDLYDIPMSHSLFKLTARPTTVWDNMLHNGHISKETYDRGLEYYNKTKIYDEPYGMRIAKTKEYKCTKEDERYLKLTFPYKRIPWDPVRKVYLRKKDLDKLKNEK
jgi:predicted transcriptional regulator